MKTSRSELEEPLTPLGEDARLARAIAASEHHDAQLRAAGAAAGRGAGASADEDDEDAEDEAAGYSLDSLSAVLRPVMITMFLATVAVANVRDAAQDVVAQVQGPPTSPRLLRAHGL